MKIYWYAKTVSYSRASNQVASQPRSWISKSTIKQSQSYFHSRFVSRLWKSHWNYVRSQMKKLTGSQIETTGVLLSKLQNISMKVLRISGTTPKLLIVTQEKLGLKLNGNKLIKNKWVVAGNVTRIIEFKAPILVLKEVEVGIVFLGERQNQHHLVRSKRTLYFCLIGEERWLVFK